MAEDALGEITGDNVAPSIVPLPQGSGQAFLDALLQKAILVLCNIFRGFSLHVQPKVTQSERGKFLSVAFFPGAARAGDSLAPGEAITGPVAPGLGDNPGPDRPTNSYRKNKSSPAAASSSSAQINPGESSRRVHAECGAREAPLPPQRGGAGTQGGHGGTQRGH